MRKRLNLLLIGFFILGLSACATIPVPQSPAQKIAYVKATLSGLNNSAVQLLQTGQIDVQTAKDYEKRALEAKEIISLAEKALAIGDNAGAMSQWELANRVLIELNQYLLERSQTK